MCTVDRNLNFELEKEMKTRIIQRTEAIVVRYERDLRASTTME